MRYTKKKASFILSLVCALGFCWWAVYQFKKGYNEAHSSSVQIDHEEIKRTNDSIAYYQKQYDHYYEIEQLSFTLPVTPRHVKLKELFQVQELVQKYRNRIKYLKFKVRVLEGGGKESDIIFENVPRN